MREQIDVLVVEPGYKPYKKTIENGLESLQKEVGGYIQAVYPFDDPVAIICNEEGKLMGLPLNRSLRDDRGEIYDVVAGNFLVVGLTEDNFGSLHEDLMKKYSHQFRRAEEFLVIDGTVISIPVKTPVKRNTEMTNAEKQTPMKHNREHER